MATACAEIVCPESCSAELPDVSFDLCNPDVHFGQISDVFITNVGNPLVDETSPVEWSDRLALASSNPSRIIQLMGIGDKPAAESNVIEISKGRKVSGNKNHTVNFRIDEVSDLNYEMMRKFECNKTVLMWYKTYEGKLYGGASGIQASIGFNHVIPENSAELETLVGSITWKAKHHPCRTDYPLQGDSES
jgi:hypothetical protein